MEDNCQCDEDEDEIWSGLGCERPPNVHDLKNEILRTLPFIVGHQSTCKKSDRACKLNKKLLQYFIEHALIKNNEDAGSTRKPVKSDSKPLDVQSRQL